MARYHKRGGVCVPSLLAGIALGAAIIYFGSSVIKAGSSAGQPMCLGGCGYAIDVTGLPYSIAAVPGTSDFPQLPEGQTSVTGVYPPATGPY